MTSANPSLRQRNRWLLAATLILLAGAALRLLWLHDVPPGLAQDEVLNADIVENIRQGQHAFFFREGYGHEPLYHYWSVPFQVLLGDNVLSIRLPAFTLGLFLIAAAMRWLRRDVGRLAALVGGGGLALSWWPILFSRVGLRPILEPLLLVGVAWFWQRRPWLAGVCLGLALYSYTAARALPLLPLLFLVYLAVRRLSFRRGRPSPAAGAARWQPAVVILGVCLLLALPLFVTLQGDPTLDERARQLSGPLAALRAGDWQPIWETTRATLGVFAFTGDPRWTYALPDQPLFDPFTALFFFGGLGLALRRWRQPQYGWWLLWLALALLPSAVTPDAPSLVRLVGAMPLVYALPALFVQELISRSEQQRTIKPAILPPLTTIGLALLLLLNGGRTWLNGFQQWPTAVETRQKYQSVVYEMAQQWHHEPAAALVVGDDWVDPIDVDSLRRNLGRDPQARWVQGGRALVFPALAESSGGRALLYAPEYAPPAPDLLQMAAAPPEPIYRSAGDPSFAVWELPAVPASAVAETVAAAAAPVTFAGRLTFLGYQWLPGPPPRLITQWRVEQALPADIAIFAHILDQDGNLIGQHDGFDAFAPTLQAGDVVWQWHPLPLPPDAPPPATLALGLYTRGNLARLTHEGEPADQIRITLAEP